MDILASILYPGFEPGTFDVAAGSTNHYTTRSALNETIFTNNIGSSIILMLIYETLLVYETIFLIGITSSLSYIQFL